ncbi:hypothetical protein AB733_20060 [Photobacterium swingsii]|uniref:Uncharacterized protein n=1 Tax=Photobacterium swingsii TaxID=680026 RepID=A0A0J8XUM5_9GAMM|nr:hypothetical protein [Photobacterium swingsii]KMV29074.1 hypothetical protein AB733_20060 [Photobacterium swingsii]PSW19104.1 hypothetical protein C9I94_23830 [Photobacterium swingsii]
MLGSLTSLTGGGGLKGGSSGPATATSTVTHSTKTTNESGFKGGELNMGSKNGIPTWALLLGGVAVLWILSNKGK